MRESSNVGYTPLEEPIPITEHKWPEGTKPLVTTRTMAYEEEDYIRACIEGILMQKTTFPVQVMIHDDASTDKTAEIIREYECLYPHLITAYYQSTNSHTSPKKAELRGPFISKIAGKYIALCEGDDYWTDPLKLQKQVDFLEANPDYGLVHTDTAQIDVQTGNLLMGKNRAKGITPPSGWVFEYLLMNNFIATLTVVMKSDLYLQAYDSLNQWMEPQCRRDISNWLEISRIAMVKYLPDITAVYRKIPGSLSRPHDPAKLDLFGRRSLDILLAFHKRYAVDQDIATKSIEAYIDRHWILICKRRELFIDVDHYLRAIHPGDLKSKLFKMFYKLNINPDKIIRYAIGIKQKIISR